MVPRKPRSKPTIDEAVLEWNVIFGKVVQSIHDMQQLNRDPESAYSETAVEVAAQVAAEIWKGVDHGDDA